MSSSLKFITFLSASLVSAGIKADQPVCHAQISNIEYTRSAINRATDILNFNAISDGQKVYINWASGNEKKYDYYTIEKAKDGINFEPAVMIKGAGNVTNQIDYLDIDYTPYAGVSYYRLKQTDYNGEVSYSEPAVVNYSFLKDGAFISCNNSILDAAELKDIADKMILVVLKDNTGKDYVTKVQVTGKEQKLYATERKSKLKPGNYFVMASSYNRMCGQTLLFK